MPLSRTGLSVESWAGPSVLFEAATEHTTFRTVAAPGASDGRALQLRLDADPQPGAAGGATIRTVRTYRYGTFATRLRTANCAGQRQAGVITGAFTFANDGTDLDQNGLADNDEIDIEILCAQPEVLYLTIWTDYDELTEAFHAITRIVDLRAGTVVSTCYREAYGGPCAALEPGENVPAIVPAIPRFDSAARFRTYGFDWRPGRVSYFTTDNAGHRVLLWDYRGPAGRIPDRHSAFLQNVTHTRTWDPLGGVAHDPPSREVSALIDSTTLPGE